MRGDGGAGDGRSWSGRRPDVGELPVDEDVRREVESHLEMRVEELVSAGWDPEEARAEARRAFGNVEEVERAMREETRAEDRAVERARTLDGLWQDLRYAVRRLRSDPGFTAVAILILTLGIGATTAVFSIVEGVLLRPLPYPEPDRLVWVAEWQEQRPSGMSVAWPNYLDWRERATSFDALAAHTSYTATVLGGTRPVRARRSGVTTDFWRVFPVVPVAGRLTGPEDHRADAAPVAVVSEGFWRNELGSRPTDDLRLEIGPLVYRVVGVVGTDFDYPAGTDVWVPTELDDWGDSRTAHNLTAVGRLAPEIDPARADEELDRITAAVMEGVEEDPEYLAQGALVLPLRERMTAGSRTPLLLLMGAAGMVLLTACVNLASTLLARGTVRRRELAVRGSLGARRSRLVRQLLTESLVLAAMGAAGGVALARAALELLPRVVPVAIPRVSEVGLDAAALGFAALVAVATTVLFGLLPALRLTRGGLTEGLRAGDRGGSGRRARVWKLLVGTEVALTLLLLVGSGLLVRSFRQVVTEEPGFSAEGVTVSRVSLSRIRHETAEDHVRWYRELLRDLGSRPGVEAAALTSTLPLAGFTPSGRIELDGDMEKTADATYVAVSGDYFDALDIPLLAGRSFDDRDADGAPMVAMVSESFAERFWPGLDPLGRSVTGGGMDGYWEDRPFATVVGVVADVRYEDLARRADPTVYFPYTQRPARVFWGGGTLVVEEVGTSEGSAPALLREVVPSHDPDVPLRARPLEEVVASSVAERRFLVSVLGAFAVVATVLAMVGIYGVVSYTVSRRQRELGIRLALGAEPGSVRRMVLLQTVRMVAGGLLVGSVAALLAAELMAGLLHEIGPRDPVTFAVVVALLVVAALAAGWLPAARSTRVDPALTMKAE